MSICYHMQDYLNATQQFSASSHTNYEAFVSNFTFYKNLTLRFVVIKQFFGTDMCV